MGPGKFIGSVTSTRNFFSSLSGDSSRRSGDSSSTECTTHTVMCTFSNNNYSKLLLYGFFSPLR